jgi:D-tyrosyl-tRNA(Tyr) deacylase
MLNNNMKLVIQRVKKASVTIDNKLFSEINKGLMILVGLKDTDNDKIFDWMLNKIINLRIFEDNDDKMNLSVKDINGQILLVPNFTLYGNAKKGFRPSFTEAAKPSDAEELFNQFSEKLSKTEIDVKFGKFGAMMDVSLINNGPVTIIIEKE